MAWDDESPAPVETAPALNAATSVAVASDSSCFEGFVTHVFLPSRVALGRAPKTVQGYRQDLARYAFPVMGDQRLADISAAELQQFVLKLRMERGLDPKYIRNIYGAIRAALSWAERSGELPTNPARGIELPRADKQTRWRKNGHKKRMAWSRAELQAFFGAAPPEHEMVRWAVIGATTGMRPAEQCARTWEDWRADRLEIWTSVYETDVAERRANPALPRFLLGDLKVGEGRSIRLTTECMTVLDRQRSAIEEMVRLGRIRPDAAAFIFPGRPDEQPHTNPARIYERWRSLLRGETGSSRREVSELMAGVRYITPYGLRHTHATDLLRAGRSMKLVADRLGTSIQMIDRHYGHILREIEAEAIDTIPPLGFDRVPVGQR